MGKTGRRTRAPKRPAAPVMRREPREDPFTRRDPGPRDWRLLAAGGALFAAGVGLLAWDRPYSWGLAALAVLFAAAGLLMLGMAPAAKTVLDHKARRWAAAACFAVAAASLAGHMYQDATTEGFEVTVADKEVRDVGGMRVYFEYSVQDAQGAWHEVPPWLWRQVGEGDTVRCANSFDLVPMRCERAPVA